MIEQLNPPGRFDGVRLPKEGEKSDAAKMHDGGSSGVEKDVVIHVEQYDEAGRWVEEAKKIADAYDAWDRSTTDEAARMYVRQEIEKKHRLVAQQVANQSLNPADLYETLRVDNRHTLYPEINDVLTIAIAQNILQRFSPEQVEPLAGDRSADNVIDLPVIPKKRPSSGEEATH